MIALFAVTAAGRRAAAAVAAALDGPSDGTRGWGTAAVPHDLADLPDLWPKLDGAVFFLATGATVRLIAPLLADKRTDPGVVCVDEARRFAVALTGGHEGGANALAARVGAALGATPVITTGSDAAATAGLDELAALLDAHVDGDAAAAGVALLDGSAELVNPLGFPLPPVGPTPEPGGVRHRIVVTDRLRPAGPAPGSGPVSDPGPARGTGPVSDADAGLACGTGPVSDADAGPACGTGPVSDAGAGLACGSGPVSDPGPARGSGPVSDADAGLACGTGPVSAPDPVADPGPAGPPDPGSMLAVVPAPEVPGGRPASGPRPTDGSGWRDRPATPGLTHGSGVGVAGAPAMPVTRLVPPTLVVGIGSARGVPAAAVRALLRRVEDEHGFDLRAVGAYASIDVKADEPGILAAIAPAPLHTYPAEVLSRVAVPNPSDVVRAEVGTPSVAEAAALHHAGERGELVVEKIKSENATLAVARVRPRGRLAVVGLGPGAADLRVPRADAELRRASVIVGLDQYVEQVRHLLRPGTVIHASGLGEEEQRAADAVALAAHGHAVALIGSGDAGIYAMGSPALEAAGPDVEVVGVPGVTAALAAASLLGAPLGHDHVLISLSDLHTPWPVIEQRVRAAAAADLVTCFYNPRSRDRHWQLAAALDAFRAHRPPSTPVGAVRQAGRSGQRVWTAPLDTFDAGEVDMLTTVVVGSSTTRMVAGRMVTPRGYRWAGPADAEGGRPEPSRD